MNFHSFLDVLTVKSAALAVGNKGFFSSGVSAPSFREQLSGITLELPAFSGEGSFEVEAPSIVGQLDPAFFVAQWLGHDYPTLIYHHGNNERPFDFGPLSKNTFKHIILKRKESFRANLIAIRAPFHQDLKYYLQQVRHLDRFSAMLCVSVSLVEALISRLKDAGRQPVLLAGISLGGWITNMHRSYFNTADAYVPLLAGAALGDLFTSSIYRQLAGRLALGHPEIVRGALNFVDDFNRVKADNVFPLLARYDRIIEMDRQKRCYDERPIEMLNKGHVTATLDDVALSGHILRRLEVLNGLFGSA